MRDGGRAVDEPGERERPDRVEARRRERELSGAPAARRGRRRSRTQGRCHLEGERLDDDPERRVRVASRARSSRSSARSQPGRSRRTRPRGAARLRPPIARSPRTENITAGSVGAIAAPSRPHVIQPRPSAQCANSAISPAVANVPATPERRDRDADRAEAAEADRRAAVEQDHDQRDRPDPLHRLGRRASSDGAASEATRGGDEEQRRGRHRDPGAQLAREQCGATAPPRQKGRPARNW